MEYTNVKLTDGMNEEELRAIGWRRCNTCKEMRSPDLYYKAKKTNGLFATCKICHRKQVRSYRKVEGSYAYYYRRIEKMRSHARQRGLKFSLLVADYKELKNADKCFYCGMTTNMITLDRADNTVGYIKENMRASCFLCNKIKGNIFNEPEMLAIGKIVAEYSKRVNRDTDSRSNI